MSNKTNKQNNMKNQMNINEAISATAIEAVEDMRMEILNGCTITRTIYNSTIELTISLLGFTFETSKAKAMFVSHVSHEIATKFNKFHAIVFPKCAMDQNGNYTYDQSKWA